MTILAWSDEKNELVKDKTGVSFEDIEQALAEGKQLADILNPNKKKYGHQRIMIVDIRGYAYAVPYVRQDDGSFFLKTLYPCRKYKQLYLDS